MFSQVVDTVVERSNRVDQRDIIVGIANGIIRRIQSKQYFQSDLRQITLTASSQGLVQEEPGKWVWTRTPDVRLISAVRYMPSSKYPPNNQPAVGQALLSDYWYKVGDKYVFIFSDGCLPFLGDELEEERAIEITYYSFSPEFKYYPEKTREFTYSWDTNNWYKRNASGDAEPLSFEEVTQREKELAAYGNWLLRDYKEVVISGTLAKLFGLLDDSERFKREFAEFGDLFATLTNNERYANFGY